MVVHRPTKFRKLVYEIVVVEPMIVQNSREHIFEEVDGPLVKVPSDDVA